MSKNIQITVKTLTDHLSVCYVKHKVTNLSTWFLFEESNYQNMLKKALTTVSIGYTRKLILHGVGFKAELLNDQSILSLRIGKKLPANSNIPENVYIHIEDNVVNAWAPNISVIDNFFFNILKNKAIKKGTITISN